MSRVFTFAVTILSASLGGCTSLGETIQQRVSIAETCRQVMEAPLPEGATPNAYLASIRMGDIESCSSDNSEGILALCAYEQIEKKYRGSQLPADAKDNAVLLKAVFEDQFKKLKSELRKLAAVKQQYSYAELMQLPPPARLAAMQDAVQQTAQIKASIAKRLDSLRKSLAALRADMAKASSRLSEQEAIELAAWDSNVRAQLEQLEQVLAGNASLIRSETIKDQVVRHVAKRSLDLVHGALKPAQTVIDKLDDKAYGLISVSYLFFQPSLQDAVNDAYDNVRTVYRTRLADNRGVKRSAEENKQYVDTFLGEMQRAACENLIEGSKFSMTTELVDTMLINKAKTGKAFGARPPAPDNLRQQGNFPATIYAPASFIMDERASLPAQAAAPLHSPLSVYVGTEWAARQQLLIQSISAQRKAAGADAAKQFPGIATVDEADLRRLADAATARLIDDASRANPALLDMHITPPYLSASLTSNVNIVVAASAVSQANAVLMASLSNSNVNTFNPTNAPVFNLPAHPASTGSGPTPQPPSLCAEGDFGRADASCMFHGGDYIIVFDRGVGYAGDACESDDALRRLSGVADIVRNYGDRHGVRFETSVAGYASIKPAALTACTAAQQPPKVACTYRNRAREEIAVTGCANPNGDKNLLLSAARAKHAAVTLEQASGGSLLVRGIAAGGAQARDDIYPAYLAAAEQTVVLRFRPLD